MPSLRTARLSLVPAALLTALLAGTPAGAQQRRASPLPQAEAARPAMGEEATWSLAAVGDAIVTRRLAQFDQAGDQRFQEMARIIREADAALAGGPEQPPRGESVRALRQLRAGAAELCGPGAVIRSGARPRFR